MAKIDMTDHFARGNIDDQHLVTIDTRLANASASVNRHEGEAAIGACGHLMPMHAGSVVRHGGEQLAAGYIKAAGRAVALIRNQQRWRAGSGGSESQPQNKILLHDSHRTEV